MNLTLFTTPKPFKGQAAVHQANAIESWTHIEPRPEIILYGNEPGASELAERLGIIHRTGIDRLMDIPLLHSLFAQAQAEATNPYMVYLNADIMILDGLPEAVQRADGQFNGHFLGICRRNNLTLNEPLDFSGDWRGKVYGLLRDRGERHSTCSSDIFAWKRPLWALEAFTVGRPGWDNWMFWKATDVGWPVVDFSKVVVAAHPDHGHGPQGNTCVKDFWRKDDLARRNGTLIGHGHQYCLRHVRQAGWLHEMAANSIDYIFPDVR